MEFYPFSLVSVHCLTKSCGICFLDPSLSLKAHHLRVVCYAFNFGKVVELDASIPLSVDKVHHLQVVWACDSCGILLCLRQQLDEDLLNLPSKKNNPKQHKNKHQRKNTRKQTI